MKEESRNMAFNQLVRKYQQKVYWHIRKMVIDHEDADDLTQEVFIKVWKHLENFRQDAQLYTWLYRIATNECLNFLKSKKRKFFLPINDVEAELTAKIDQADNMTGDEIQLKLQKALLKLPDKQRLVFNMKYYDDLKYEEISEILGTSVGALKASYHLAVKKIEEYVTKD
jgi:RNA polymerase sigma-70 factor (ECF subfamily)